ncbi:THUMP domain-containing protein [Alkalilimnicola ehrlichii]|uniref:THUMP domain-containing protein n=1 Tax=Alkalilimnicola ehrlichii TaxID=351052 RepID=UPI00267D3AF2|nr:THUMP domain-containing protein [Alkalilimnicola ehrlichii]
MFLPPLIRMLNDRLNAFLCYRCERPGAASGRRTGKIGAKDVRPGRGGASFQGPLGTAYRACLWSRLANRILLPLSRFPAETPDALYQGIREIDWSLHLAAEGSLAVDFVAQRSQITHSHFGALKVKDAIVDQFRDCGGQRPSVSLQEPDVRINVYLYRDEAQVSLDLSGESLHRRGYREQGAAAPLKETLAAALLLRAGWPAIAANGGALIDPLCGSGTLPIEAALIAGDIAPGLNRTYYGFLRWRGHDEAAWKALIDEAIEREEQGLQRIPPIAGFDKDLHAVQAALGNVARAGLQGKVHIERRSLDELRPIGKRAGLLVANPPYGERIGETSRLIPLYNQLGALAKRYLPGWRAAIFTGNRDLIHQIGLRAEKTYTLYNGPLECRLSLYPIAEREATREQAGPDGATDFANRLRKTANASTVGDAKTGSTAIVFTMPICRNMRLPSMFIAAKTLGYMFRNTRHRKVLLRSAPPNGCEKPCGPCRKF